MSITGITGHPTISEYHTFIPITKNQYLQMYIVNDSIETIIAVNDLNKCGFLVHFAPDNANIQHIMFQYSFELLYYNGLYYIDLNKLIQTNASSKENAIHSLKQINNIDPRVIDFHNRFGHMSKKNMLIATASKGSIFNTQITPENIHSTFNNWECLICTMGKRNKPSIPSNTTPPLNIIGHTISADILPNITPVSINGDTCAFIFTCVFSGFLHGFVSNTKTDSLLSSNCCFLLFIS